MLVIDKYGLLMILHLVIWNNDQLFIFTKPELFRAKYGFVCLCIEKYCDSVQSFERTVDQLFNFPFSASKEEEEEEWSLYREKSSVSIFSM